MSDQIEQEPEGDSPTHEPGAEAQDPFVHLGQVASITHGTAGYDADEESGWHGGPSGPVDCQLCKGGKTRSCPKCGSGNPGCPLCEGTGIVNCPRCGGSGVEP